MNLRLATCFTLLLALCTAPALAQSITGSVHVIDGDTLAMGAERIRIHGINAPESDQRCDNGRWACGKEATQAMTRLIAGSPVACHGRERDHYGRLVAVCYNRQGQDLGQSLVQMGMATAYRRYSSDYVSAEASARAAQRGVWSGEFQDPESFNRQGQASSGLSSMAGLPSIPGVSGTSGMPNGVMGAANAVMGWAGKMAGAAAERSRHTQGQRLAERNTPEYQLTAPDRYGYVDFHDYNNDNIVDGGPRRSSARTSRSALTPPSAGAAPPGMQLEGPLSADQVCAVMALAGQPCR